MPGVLADFGMIGMHTGQQRPERPGVGGAEGRARAGQQQRMLERRAFSARVQPAQLAVMGMQFVERYGHVGSQHAVRQAQQAIAVVIEQARVGWFDSRDKSAPSQIGVAAKTKFADRGE